MAGKDTIRPIPAISNGDMSQATIIGLPILIQGFDNPGFQLVYTGTPVGVFTVQMSQDQITWTTAPDSLFSPAGPIAATGVSDDIIIEFNQVTMAYIRLKYTKTSGTGTLSALFTAKLV